MGRTLVLNLLPYIVIGISTKQVQRGWLSIRSDIFEPCLHHDGCHILVRLCTSINQTILEWRMNKELQQCHNLAIHLLNRLTRNERRHFFILLVSIISDDDKSVACLVFVWRIPIPQLTTSVGLLLLCLCWRAGSIREKHWCHHQLINNNEVVLQVIIRVIIRIT